MSAPASRHRLSPRAAPVTYRRRSVRLVLIANPFSSSVSARARVVIRKALSTDHDVELVETQRRDHATVGVGYQHVRAGFSGCV